jgi:hypothetical protein
MADIAEQGQQVIGHNTVTTLAYMATAINEDIRLWIAFQETDGISEEDLVGISAGESP